MSSSRNTSQALRSIGASYRRNSVFTVNFLHKYLILKHGAPLGTSGFQPRKGFGVIATGMFVVLCGLMMIFPGHLSIVSAQSEVSDAIEPWMAVITNEKATVRCGSSDQYYAVGNLKKGDLVRVIDVNNESGWAKVDSTEGLSGFINANDVKLSYGGKNAVVISDCIGSYPKEDDPRQSWKRIQFKAGTTLAVITIVNTDTDSFVRVRLPADVPVSIPVSFIRRATDEEVATWLKRKSGTTTQTKKATPPTASKTKADNTTEITTTPEAKSTPAASNDDNAVPKEIIDTHQEKAEVSTSEGSEENAVSTTDEVKEPVDIENDASSEKGVDTVPDGLDTTGIDKEEASDKGEVSGETTDDDKAKESVIASTLSFGELEDLYEQLKKTPILEAEIEPITEGYRKIIADPNETTTHRRLAEVRVRLLTIRLQTQHARQRMEAALNEADFSIAKSQVEREALLDSDLLRTGVQGRLALSNVFDGKRLPMLYRLRDVITGRTIAYVRSEKMDDLRSFTGQNITLIGKRVMDPVLGVLVLDKARVMNGDE